MDKSKLTSPAALGQPMLTSLSSRNTEDVIADLKRPLHTFPPTTTKRRQSSLSVHVPSDSDPTNPPPMENGLDANGNSMPESDDLEAEDEDEEDDDTNLQIAKPQQISERKRRRIAIANNHVLEVARESLKEDIKNNNSQNMEDQSARYIIDQAQSQKIISTPREYQTELFERAKEKNIIAVLNTGKPELQSPWCPC